MNEWPLYPIPAGALNRRFWGANLRAWRDRHGYSLRDAARRLGVDKTKLQRLEAGQTAKSPDVYWKIWRRISGEFMERAKEG